MKKFGIFLIVLAAIGAGVYFTAPSLESIVQTVVHKYGSQVTGTEVNLGGFKLSLLKGEVEINNLTVANPKNYTQPNIMSVGRVAVKVNLKSVLSDTIVVENVEIEKPEITYELLSLTQNNLSQLLDNIKKNTASGSKEKEQAQSKKIIGRLAHTKDPLSWGSVIVSLSVPVPWHYRRRHARRQ